MNERKGVVTMKGAPLTLVGNEVRQGNSAPDVTLLANDLSEVQLSSYKGKICVISAVPSLDTSVCDMSTRRFNRQAAALGDDVVIVTVSADLPFAQARWCGAAGVENVITLSDHRDTSFGRAYGVLLKEPRLLARAVFVVDKDGVVRYEQIVPELTEGPDFDAVLSAVKSLKDAV